jgi:SSS family solute:Na+ symporter
MGLLAGWAAGMAVGTWMAFVLQFKGTVYPLHLAGLTIPAYAAVWALIVNLLVSAAVSYVLRLAGVPMGEDATRPEDYGP